ncbi:hypothetical protein [Streptomyces sp. SID13031]|uniref:hypothetical protein n=1 Tax=Streptomyces sp. SID13031 TaxID=2706046 RepID=UPI0013C5805B|nr:hypothetical protein [Streptomyces sp. SID13031]NEA31016.1 hypothetical protein [Streptomyces sp. SID13031]
MATVSKVVAGAISSVPVAGGVVAAWFQNYMEAPYSKRLEEWQKVITEVVNELADKYNTLPDDQVLLDAMVNATRAAQATHQKEKIAALRNAIVNSVAPEAPDADEQARFFRLVDQFSAIHIVVLRFLDEPEVAFNQLGLTWPSGPHDSHARLGELLDHVVADGASRHDWRDLVIDDLARARVVLMFSSVDDIWVRPEMSQSFVTELGRRFLRFVSENE